MKNDLTSSERDFLLDLAVANGFDSVETFVHNLLGTDAAIADQNTSALHMNGEALSASRDNTLDGQTRDLREALIDIANRYSLPIGC